MRFKKGVAAILIAGAVGLSTLGLGSGVASAASSPGQAAAMDQTTVQAVGWHGRGGGHHGGYGFRHGHGRGYFPVWHLRGFRPWRPW